MKKYLLIETEYYSIEEIKTFDTREEAEKEAIKQAIITFEKEFISFDEILEYQSSDNWQCDEVYRVFHINEINI